jgi:hypothetical protein
MKWIKMKKLTINDRFKRVFAPLSEKEYSDLELLLQRDGCMNAIITWHNQIVDGHNRYEICNRLGIEFDTFEKKFDNEDEVELWIRQFGVGRRSLNEYVRIQNEKSISELELRVNGRENQSIAGGDRKSSKKSLLSPSDKSDIHPINSREIIAKKVGVSTGKIAQFDIVEKHANDETKERLTRGLLSIREVYNDIKTITKKEKKDTIRREMIEKSKSLKTGNNVTLTCGDCLSLSKDLDPESISLIVTDPPYPIEFIDTWSKLGKIAMNVLKPSGFCVAYTGKLHLPEVIQRMTSEGLEYYWQFILIHKGLPAAVHGRKINTGYKPVLVFQKPPFKQISNYCSDIIQGTGKEKEGHDWQQGEAELKQIFDIFYEVGTVLDPFAGSGTTLSYCKNNSIPVIGYELYQDTYKIALARIGESK